VHADLKAADLDALEISAVSQHCVLVKTAIRTGVIAHLVSGWGRLGRASGLTAAEGATDSCCQRGPKPARDPLAAQGNMRRLRRRNYLRLACKIMQLWNLVQAAGANSRRLDLFLCGVIFGSYPR